MLEINEAPYREPYSAPFKVVYCCLVESGLLVVVSVLDCVVVVSVFVPVVVCGVSHEAIAKPISATNRMRFISLFLKLKNNYCFTFNYSAKYYHTSIMLSPLFD